jgi:hypothetical protein
MVTDAGTEQPTCGDDVAQLRAAFPENPFTGEKLSVKLVEPPALTVAVVEPPDGGAMVKSVAVPSSAIVCGLPLAFVLMVTDAARLPTVVGLKVTVITQFAPLLTLPPQLSLRVKSPAFAPVSVMPEIVSVAPPLLVSVTVCAALVVPTSCALKLKDATPIETAAGVTPMPIRLMMCGLPAASSVKDTAPVRVPVVLGVNVTLMVQLAVGASDAPQLSVFV